MRAHETGEPENGARVDEQLHNLTAEPGCCPSHYRMPLGRVFPSGVVMSVQLHTEHGTLKEHQGPLTEGVGRRNRRIRVDH
jgi:hypothetical protein